MSNVYYVLDNEEEKGPYTLEELNQLDIDIHTKILSPKTGAWESAGDLPDLYPLFEARGIYLPTGDNLASFGWRFLAFVVDYIVLIFLMNFVMNALALGGMKLNFTSYTELMKMPKQMIILQLIFHGTFIVYNTICEFSPMKGSLGKKLCRMVVVDANGDGLNFQNALLRSVGKSVSIFLCYLGFLSIFFTEHKQAVHDQLAKTYVVKL